jgi:hypothetical protein
MIADPFRSDFSVAKISSESHSRSDHGSMQIFSAAAPCASAAEMSASSIHAHAESRRAFVGSRAVRDCACITLEGTLQEASLQLFRQQIRHAGRRSFCNPGSQLFDKYNVIY